MQVTTTPENFKKTFKPYLVKWSIAYGILMSFVTVLPFFRDYMNELAYDPLTFGLNFVSLIAIGINVAGLIAVGYNAAGVIAIGYNAVGIIAVGCNTAGIVSIGGNAWGVATIGWHTFRDPLPWAIVKQARANTYSHRIAKMPRQYPSLHGGSPS